MFQIIPDTVMRRHRFNRPIRARHSTSGARFVNASDEHGVIELDAAGDWPGLGDKILLVPCHCDPTVDLHDWYVCVRDLGGADAYVEAVWPVAGRGAVF